MWTLTILKVTYDILVESGHTSPNTVSCMELVYEVCSMCSSKRLIGKGNSKNSHWSKRDDLHV